MNRSFRHLRKIPGQVLLATALIAPVSPCQTWQLGNGHVQRVVSFSPSSGLTTANLTDLDTRTSFISEVQRDAAEFSLHCNDQTLRGAGRDFALVKGEVEDEPGNAPNGKELRVTLRANKLPLEITVVYRIDRSQSGMRKWLVLRNTGSAPMLISHLVVESIAPSVGPSSETLLNALYGAVPREILYTGRSEDAGLLISNGSTGEGFAVLNEVPGYMKRTEIDGFSHPSRVLVNAMYDTDLMPFERTLQPGESWQTAGVSLVFFQRGAGFSDPHWAIPSYTAAVLERKLGRGGSPWIYNTWNPFRRTINQSIVHQLIDVASSMGIGIFTIDDGWEERYGENAVNRAAFPDGLEPIRKAIEAKGMRLGLWMPLAVVDKDTAIYQEHPEWVAAGRDGKPKMTSTAAGEEAVMCLASPYRDVAADRINDAIERYHLAYVKLDLTTVFNAYGESPGCWPTPQHRQSWAESLGRIYESIHYVTAKVYAKHPDVLIDLSFELWGEKHLIDAGLLTYGDLDWLSNVNDSQPDAAGLRQARTLLYQRAVSMPTDAMLIGNVQADMPDPPEVFATEIASAPLLLGDLRRLTPNQREWYRQHIAWFKHLRSEVDLRDSFFPLGNWQQPSPVAWDGYARLARNGSGVVTVFRNESKLPSVKVRLPLVSQGRFQLRSAMTGRSLGIVTGAMWKTGVDVRFVGHQKVEMIEVRNLKATPISRERAVP